MSSSLSFGNSSAAQQGINAARPDTELEANMGALRASIERLQNSAETLRDRLGPVLQDPRPMPATPPRAPSADAQSMHTRQLAALEDQVVACTDTVQDVLQRLVV